jgi:hypothetical protein
VTKIILDWESDGGTRIFLNAKQSSNMEHERGDENMNIEQSVSLAAASARFCEITERRKGGQGADSTSTEPK